MEQIALAPYNGRVEIIIIKVPARIDLAGGTLDIWPLSVIFLPSVCINAAINLYATVRAEKLAGVEGLLIHAEGFIKKPLLLPRRLPENGKNLFDRVFEEIPISGWKLTVKCESPAGAGLGGSSALLIALLKIFARLSRKKMSGMETLRMAQNIEARHLGIPTGVQDYAASLNGGLNVIRNSVREFSVSKLKMKPSDIEKRVVLAYSGKSRVSGKANWLMIKKVIDGDKTARRVFAGIAQNSLRVREALESGRFSSAGALMEAENKLREKLGRAVIPARLQKIFSAVKRAGGHPKICGAGGGGCFIVWCEPEIKTKIEKLLVLHKMKLLNFKLAPRISADIAIARRQWKR